MSQLRLLGNLVRALLCRALGCILIERSVFSIAMVVKLWHFVDGIFV